MTRPTGEPVPSRWSKAGRDLRKRGSRNQPALGSCRRLSRELVRNRYQPAVAVVAGRRHAHAELLIRHTSCHCRSRSEPETGGRPSFRRARHVLVERFGILVSSRVEIGAVRRRVVEEDGTEAWLEPGRSTAGPDTPTIPEPRRFDTHRLLVQETGGREADERGREGRRSRSEAGAGML